MRKLIPILVLLVLPIFAQTQEDEISSFYVRVKEAEFSDPVTVEKLTDIFYDATELMKKPKGWGSWSLARKRKWAMGSWLIIKDDSTLGACREWRCSESQLKDNVIINKMNQYKGQLNPLVGNKDYIMGITDGSTD